MFLQFLLLLTFSILLSVFSQPSSSDFRARFWADANCQGEFSELVAKQNFCQRVVGTPTSSFKITCNTQRTGGNISFFNDPSCSSSTSSSSSKEFVSGTCLSNTGPGAKSFALTCEEGSFVLPPPECDRCLVSFFEFPSCTGSRTVLNIPAGTCFISGTGQGSILVQRNGTSTSTPNDSILSFCDDPQCASCNVQTSFVGGQCRPNPPGTGTSSITAICGAVCLPPSPAPSSSPVPSTTATSSPSPSSSLVPSVTPSASASVTASVTASSLPSFMPSSTASPSASSLPSFQGVPSPSATPSTSAIASPSASVSVSASATAIPSMAPPSSLPSPPAPLYPPPPPAPLYPPPPPAPVQYPATQQAPTTTTTSVTYTTVLSRPLLASDYLSKPRVGSQGSWYPRLLRR